MAPSVARMRRRFPFEGDRYYIALAMRLPGTGEILFILLLCLVVFGGSKVNWIGDMLGGFVRNLRRGLKNDDRIALKPTDEPSPRDDNRPTG